MRLCPKCGKKCQEARCPDDGTATLVLAANPDSRLAEGTEVNGRYRIRNMIGQGGFGAVYRATNIATDQDMAIKLLAVSLDSDDSDVIQRFFAEAQVTASLKHPNTIRVFDFGQTEGGALYIAMELLSGRPLNDVLKRRAADGKVLTEEETITIGVQALRSLAEAHLANLVHRDLKPHNIFLHEVEGDDPVVKVLDFGIAKRLGSNLTGTGKAFGTPSYMSPEQAQNEPLDNRSDLYSLACVLFQCVTGKPPFEGDDPLAVLLAHVTKDPPNLRQVAATPVSEALVQVLEKAMAKHPDDRYPTAIAFRQALEGCRGRNRTEVARAASSATIAELMHSIPPPPADERTIAYGTPGEDRTASFPNLTPHGVTPAAVARSRPVPAQPRRATSTRLQAITAEPDAQDDVEPAPRSRKALWLGGAAAVAGLAAVLLFAGRDKPVGAPAEAVAATQPEPAKPAPVAPPEPVKPAAPVEAAKTEPAKPAEVVAPPTETKVELASEPNGAAVIVGGETLGHTPLTVTVPPGGRVNAVLRLNGHRELEVQVSQTDAPSKTARLTALPTAKTPPVRRPGGGKSGKDGSSSLDERI